MIFNNSRFNSSWEIKSLENLGTFNRGKSKHRPRNDQKLFDGGIYPLVQTGDIKQANLYIYNSTQFYNEFGLRQSKLWDEGTLCITIAANIAETAILKTKMCFPDSVVGFTPIKNQTTSLYMHYLFTYIRQKIQNSVQGSIQDNINIDYLTKLKFRIPDFFTQQRISAVLSSLDDKIELNNRINAELEAMAKLIYDYWFVQFDFPNEKGKPYKSSGGKMVWNEELKREIPEGWEVKMLGEVANITMGQSPEGSSYNDNGIGIIFYQGSTDFGWRFPSVRQYTTNPTRFAKAGDILLSVRAPVGTYNLAKEDCCIGRGLSALNSKHGFDSFLLYQMNYFKKKFDNINSVGTTFGSITKDELFSLLLIYPSKEILKKYESIVSNFDKQIFINTKQNQHLASLRDWLLPMLMNGQVSVVEAEEEIAMVAEGKTKYKKK